VLGSNRAENRFKKLPAMKNEQAKRERVQRSFVEHPPGPQPPLSLQLEMHPEELIAATG
jgi:hypothetical protein